MQYSNFFEENPNFLLLRQFNCWDFIADALMTVSCIAYKTLVQTCTQLKVRAIVREDQENVSIDPCRLNGFTGSNFTLERRFKYV